MRNPTTVFAWATLVFIAVIVFVFFEVQLAGSAAEQELLYESSAIGWAMTIGRRPLGSRLRRPRSQRVHTQ